MHTLKAHQKKWSTWKVQNNLDLSFIPLPLSHTPPSLSQLLYKFAVHPPTLPPSRPPSSRFPSLMAECVCIDTTPQSHTAA